MRSTFYTLGIRSVDVSVATALQETKSLFSIGMAIFALAERLTVFAATGATMIVLGSALISLEGGKDDLRYVRIRRGAFLPLMSGFLFGAGHVLRKQGLNVTPSPALATAAQNCAASALLLASLALHNAESGYCGYLESMRASVLVIL